MKKYPLLRASLLGLAIGSCSLVSAAPTLEELSARLKKQEAEIEALTEALKHTEQKIEATADALESGIPSVSGSKQQEWAAKTRIGGYGEHHYNNFDSGNDKVDAHRFVLYVAHDYSDTVRFFSELELEHGLAGEGKPGEVELEQAYIEWHFAPGHSLVTGQFLIPVGILNETHEPDTFYGVERNRVENSIVPTTWWETGAMLKGEIAVGFSYDFAVHSGLAAADGGVVRGGRQKSANAIADELAYTARIKYTGLAGVALAATVQLQEDLTQGRAADTASATLTEFHAVYRVAGFTLRALYAEWDIDGENFAVTGRDKQRGWYIEPSWRLSDSFGVFMRQSRWNNEGGLDSASDNQVTDIGMNFWLADNVVFKVDYQDAGDFNNNDSVNLGLGWSF